MCAHEGHVEASRIRERGGETLHASPYYMIARSLAYTEAIVEPRAPVDGCIGGCANGCANGCVVG